MDLLEPEKPCLRKGYVDKGKLKERYEKLKEIIAEGKPAYYTPEDYLLYVYKETRILRRKNVKSYWSKYLEIWKCVIREPLLVARNSNELWNFLRELFKKVYRTDDEDDFYDEIDEISEEVLMAYVFLLEEIDTKIAADEEEDEYKELFVELLCGLMALESEEAVLACLRNKLIPKEHVKTCINTALKFGKRRLVPALIMAQ